jgi:hypothetical protein|tara:strand:- start:1657 stop:2688 length:1032 start_codon:yes stop_codon:yes gene_type:complete
MTLVVDKFRSLLPPRAKQSPSGWTSFNAPCCHHRGHSQDTRKRAGIRFDGAGVVYNCFNCKFSTGWQPGSPLGEKMKTLSRWLGANDDFIKELSFEAMQSEGDSYRAEEQETKIEFTDKELPEGAMSLLDWVNSEYFKDISLDLEPVIAYVVGRGYDPFDGSFYWSPSPGYENRVIVPFYWEGRVVGNTARRITDGRPKYLSDQHPHFVFNFDKQREDQKYFFVCEGPFDALAVGGMALLTNEIADQQSRIISSLGGDIIVIPDQDRAGLVLFDRAAELNWSVAMPTWDNDVKDVADAVQRYGKLFVVVDAIKTAQKGAIKINMAKKQQEHKLERIEYAKENS